MLTFYNRNGTAIAFLDEDGMSIYLYNGFPAAWLEDGSIYAYSGKFLGWFQDGWVYDRNGRCAFFTDNAQGGSVKPIRTASPVRGVRGARPSQGAREARTTLPARSTSWSDLSSEAFFSQ
jgi:hypothetical protein